MAGKETIFGSLVCKTKRKLVKCKYMKEKSGLEKVLLKKRQIIDETIQKYLPRKITREYLQDFLVGKKDGYNYEVLNKTIAQPIWDFIDRGGKRWRPLLYLLVLDALGGNAKKAKDFLIIPELIHNGTLIVDDIEDESELRRGKKCLHHLFGLDVAINAGNLAYFLPLKLFFLKKQQFSAKIWQKAYEVYIQEMINVSVGQAIDIGWHRGLVLPRNAQEYYEMTRQKTGAMVRLSVKLAAIFAGAGEKTIQKLSEVSEKIGVAFQIQDDILDIELEGQDRAKFGKSFGNDIKEGKKTLMVIRALKKASPKDRVELARILNNHTHDFEEAKKAIDILRKYKTVEYAREKAKALMAQAQREIAPLLRNCKSQRAVQRLMEFLIERKH